MNKQKLINNMIDRLVLSDKEIEYITREFDFTAKKGLKIFVKSTSQTTFDGTIVREVFLGTDEYNVVQHICFI